MKILEAVKRAFYWLVEGNPPEPSKAHPPYKRRPSTPATGVGARKRPRVPADDFYLFERLKQEAAMFPQRVRRHNGSLGSAELIDQILALMFGLQKPTVVMTGDWLITAINNAYSEEQASLTLRYRIIYVYAAQASGDESLARLHSQINKQLCDRLIDRLFHQDDQKFSEHAPALARYIRQLCQTEGSKRDRNYQFEETRQHLIQYLASFMDYRLCPRRVAFPSDESGTVFFVGCNPIHDRVEIARREDELKAGVPSGKGREMQVNLALTISATTDDDKPLRINAHEFREKGHTPRPVRELCLGDWQEDWTFTVGAAEHDEIQCIEFKHEFHTVRINGLREELGRWSFLEEGWDRLPSWLQVQRKREGVLSKSLFAFLNRPAVIPQITLTARALPVGISQDALANIPRYIQDQFSGETIRAAVEACRDHLWLVRVEGGNVYRVFKEPPRSWERKMLPSKDSFRVAGFDYEWRAAQGENVPPRFCGLLFLYPEDNEKGFYVQDLAVGQGARVPISTDLFPDISHLDVLLGSNGVVTLVFMTQILPK